MYQAVSRVLPSQADGLSQGQIVHGTEAPPMYANVVWYNGGRGTKVVSSGSGSTVVSLLLTGQLLATRGSKAQKSPDHRKAYQSTEAALLSSSGTPMAAAMSTSTSSDSLPAASPHARSASVVGDGAFCSVGGGGAACPVLLAASPATAACSPGAVGTAVGGGACSALVSVVTISLENALMPSSTGRSVPSDVLYLPLASNLSISCERMEEIVAAANGAGTVVVAAAVVLCH